MKTGWRRKAVRNEVVDFVHHWTPGVPVSHHPDAGYRRLSYQMLDEEVVAVSPSSVYRVLKNAGRLR